ncbi:MAG: NAD(P)H-hydrate epimerase [Elusimicrobia bacterium]|nr:NAD(P)H-hydrate epimerase [Elusimicrobiota bacterium]
MGQLETPKVYLGLPVVTAEAMRLMDRAAVERFGLAELELMENAGKAVAGAVLRYLKDPLGKTPGQATAVVCCGRGANGADGLVAARRLREAGVKVLVFICPPRKESSYPGPVTANLERLQALGVVAWRVETADALAAALREGDIVIDALLGTGASGKPAGTIRAMIQAMNRSKKPILAVDVPSGLQPDTGYHSGVFVTAAVTLTLGLAKRGLLASHAKKYVGRLEVLDIGYPPELVKEAARCLA